MIVQIHNLYLIFVPFQKREVRTQRSWVWIRQRLSCWTSCNKPEREVRSDSVPAGTRLCEYVKQTCLIVTIFSNLTETPLWNVCQKVAINTNFYKYNFKIRNVRINYHQNNRWIALHWLPNVRNICEICNWMTHFTQRILDTKVLKVIKGYQSYVLCQEMLTNEKTKVS